MEIKDKKAAGETATNLWDDSVDYTQQSSDRPYKLRLEIGTLVYLNKEQYAFMKEEEWATKREYYLQNKCQVSANGGGLKHCTEDCIHYKGEDRICPCFIRNQNTNIVSLDKLYEENNYEVEDTSQQGTLDTLVYEEKIRIIKEEIDKLEDEVDKMIITLFTESYSERQIAKILGWNQMRVNRRKNKILNELRNKLENFKN